MFEFVPNLLDSCRTDKVSPSDVFLLLCGREVMLSGGTLPRRRDVQAALVPDNEAMLLGSLAGENYFALEIDPAYAANAVWQSYPIRQFLFESPENLGMALCRARVLLHWRNQHRFCGGCRAELQLSDHDSGLICPACGNVYYPQLAPAVIVAITRDHGRELLLAHNRNFAGNMYSLIAGFVEAGESVEAAIHREIWEECSLRVKNLRYITSQVWPFPNSLMLAFQAEYDSGIAEPDGGELSDLGWFTADDHPELPSPGSVARLVIDRIFN